MLVKLKKDLNKLADKERAKNLSRFFKTGNGQYGEGDVFLGIKVPQQREIARKYSDLSLKDIDDLLDSEIHEYRLTAVLILVAKYLKADEVDKKHIFNFYRGNAKAINNWDLVDLSAPNIVGDYLFHNQKDKKLIYNLAKSDNLWEKRIAIISTLYFIRKDNFDDTLAIAEILLVDSHDLIHKAVGWMLREVGKRDEKVLKKFLRTHYYEMPRTTLRYAIERFEDVERKKWLNGVQYPKTSKSNLSS